MLLKPGTQWLHVWYIVVAQLVLSLKKDWVMYTDRTLFLLQIGGKHAPSILLVCFTEWDIYQAPAVCKVLIQPL